MSQQNTPLSNLVLKISGDEGVRTSTIVMIVLVAIFAISTAFFAVMYVLNRRKIAEADSKLRKMEEDLKRAEEEKKLATELKTQYKLNQKIDKLKKNIENQKAKIVDNKSKKTTFDRMVDGLKSWDDLEVTGP